VVVVGGGPVGVELAAEIASEHPAARIVLVHSADRLLNDFTAGIAAHSERWLRQVAVLSICAALVCLSALLWYACLSLAGAARVCVSLSLPLAG
jgi:2-polyprenyl-6-methoxyphenol hydroxylase-like FAD-dependent oxidoreductase